MPDPSPARAASTVLLSTFDDDAVRGAVEGCRDRLGENDATLAIVFATADWGEHVDELVEIVQVYGRAGAVVGCSADGVIGSGREDENVSGCSILLLDLPDGTVDVCPIGAELVRGGSSDALRAATGVEPGATRGWLTLLNPGAGDSEAWLQRWNAAYPHTPTFGGLASGGRDAASFFVFSSAGTESDGPGAVAVSFGGTVRLEGVVSQGCTPIGEPYTITDVDQNVVLSIASRRAYRVLEEAFESLDPDEKARAQGNIFAGLAMDEYRDDFKQGDFLVRNILGGDPDAGVIALGAFPRVGQTLQFQLRDRDAADEDLRQRITTHAGRGSARPLAALLFSCTGRGTHMFDLPNHDAGILEDAFGDLPVAGFFCNGEIGPVGGTNFLHGYTASAAFVVVDEEDA